MPRVRIVHWRAREAATLIEAARSSGFDIEYDDVNFPALAKMIRANPPDALVLDLSYLPSHSRESAVYLRRTKYARHIPLIFVDGEPEKVEAVRRLLPDAIYTTTSQVPLRIKRACGRKLENPVLPPGIGERNPGRSVAQKLGIKEKSSVALINPPRNYASAIGQLPDGVEFLENVESAPVTLWFVGDSREYTAGLRRGWKLADRTKLWVIWRKGGATDLNSNVVRELGIEAGLVDYKICAVNEQWSAMAFARKKS